MANWALRLVAPLVLLGAAAPASAALITHVPNDGVPPVVVSPAFGTLAAGGEVGTAFINYGVDYSFGGREGIFNDGVLAFSGVDSNSVVDLLSPVDARIVVQGTTTQGLTSYLSVEAGYADDGNLLLEAFDVNGVLLASAVNGPPLGPHGRTTFTIDRSGVFDIASFRVSTPKNDTFGVDQVTIEAPISAAVPEPASLTLLGLGAVVGLVCHRRRARIA